VNLDVNRASIWDACDAGLLAGAVTMVWQSDPAAELILLYLIQNTPEFFSGTRGKDAEDPGSY
jgi:hypothetical protein